MATFEHDGLSFALDRSGLELASGKPVEIELDYADLGIDPDGAPEQLGVVLSRLLDMPVADEEGLFDLSVHRGGELVATLALACEDEMLEVIGERSATLAEADLAGALLATLAGS